MGALKSILVVVLVFFLLPFVSNGYLRFAYQQAIASLVAKIHPPNTVFIGDSITAGGGWFNNPRDMNLGSNGLTTPQVMANLDRARSYHSKHIAIMAGTNDVTYGYDPAKLAGLWETICQDPKIIVTLPPPSPWDEFNRKLEDIDRIILNACARRTIIRLDSLKDEHGRLQPNFSTGSVHLSGDGYKVWRDALKEVGI